MEAQERHGKDRVVRASLRRGPARTSSRAPHARQGAAAAKQVAADELEEPQGREGGPPAFGPPQGGGG